MLGPGLVRWQPLTTYTLRRAFPASGMRQPMLMREKRGAEAFSRNSSWVTSAREAIKSVGIAMRAEKPRRRDAPIVMSALS